MYFVWILFAVVMVILAIAAAMTSKPHFIVGGAPPRKKYNYAGSPHLVIDTLNLAHWFNCDAPKIRITPDVIAKTIDRATPILRARHAGQIMFVLKDRESQFNTTESRKIYRDAAIRNKVHVMVAEKYVDPPKGVPFSDEHSAKGRDDFYMVVLAHRYRCAIMSADCLMDFKQFRTTIQPFHVVEYVFWRELATRDYIRPDSSGYVRLKKPRTLHPDMYFSCKAT